MQRLVVAIAMMIAVVGPTAIAYAHQSSVKYAELRVDGDSLSITFRVAPSDVTDPLGLSPDAQPGAQRAAASPAVGPYVQRWLAVSSNGAACSASAAPITSIDADVRFVVIDWRVRCPSEIDQLQLDFTGFFAVDPRHVALVRLDAPGSDPVDLQVGSGQKIVTLHAAASLSALAELRRGIEHPALRRHACFVIALLLGVVLARRDRQSDWTLRPLDGAGKHAAVVIGAFTLGSVASWCASSWIAADADLVGVLARVSLVYVAIDVIVSPDSRWRPFGAGAFGLVFGIDFAADHGAIIYTLGVELAQLAVVLFGFPAVVSFSRQLGAIRYRRFALPGLALVVAALGTL